MTPIRKAALTAVFLVCLMQAAAAESVAHQEFVCIHGADQRTVALYTQFNDRVTSGCRVEYTKGGRTQTLWSSQSGRAYCTGKLTQLVTQLSQDSFHCTPRTIESSAERAPAR